MTKNLTFFDWHPCPLPSKGAYYDGAIPDTLQVRPLLWKDERRFEAMPDDKFIASLISTMVKDEIDFNELLTGDRITILLKIREISFGPEYQFPTACPSCAQRFHTSVDLSNLRMLFYSEADGQEPWDLVLPRTERELKIRLPRAKDDEAVLDRRREELKSGGDVDLADVEMLKRYVLEIKGMDEKTKNLFLEEGLLSMEYATIIKFVNDKMPAPVLRSEVFCPSCKYEFETGIPLGVDFFRYVPAKGA